MTDLEAAVPPPSSSDVLISRVLAGLVVVAVLDVLGIVLLAFYERPIPDALVVTLGSAVTGLASLLVGRRT